MQVMIRGSEPCASMHHRKSSHWRGCEVEIIKEVKIEGEEWRNIVINGIDSGAQVSNLG